MAEAPQNAVVWVSGGRDYQNRSRVFDILDTYQRKHGISMIIHGACTGPVEDGGLRGADRWAEEWAVKNEKPYMGIPAVWSEFSNSAGPLRNANIVTRGFDCLIAFPGGNGTRDAVRKAEAAHKPVYKIDWK